MEISTKAQATIELLQAKLFSHSAELMLSKVPAEDLPAGFNQNILKQTMEQLARFNREVMRTTEKNGTYLDKTPKREKLINIVTVVDLMARIGHEETPHIYDDLVDMIVGVIDSVFYAQKNRRNIHVGKFRLLIEMIEKELRADVDKVKTPLMYLPNQKQLVWVLGFDGDHEKIEE